MANPIAGEVAVPIGGETLALRLTVNDLIELTELFGEERATDLWYRQCLRLGGRGGMTIKEIRAVLYAAAKKVKPEITLVQIGEAITEMKVVEAWQFAATLIHRAFDTGADKVEVAKGESPKETPDPGSGPSSSTTP